ncbi:helix-turn-helix domain-containing protein [Halostella litorea]|uniref:helix-turn-helix domain-containing protein n=1 Tax=Halostella litorea TaxID=2528831 RepID=UPI001091ED81|nr:helix-turn-helix domain-containing protein [Halostella litorea]
MYEATFRVGDTEQPIPTAGREVRVDLWCNDHCDLVRAVGDDADAALADVAATVGVADRVRDGGEHVAVTEECLAARRSDNVERYVGRHGCLLLPPLRYADGERVSRVLALSGDALGRVYRDLVDDGHEVAVESKRGVDAVTGEGPLLDPGGVVPQLTARQREVLLTAVEGGYYDLPRETTTAAVAESVGVERRTAEDHLRRAERKVVEAFAGYL